ncbi:MAG: hypothetical protein K0R01_2951, partial [Mycobacterium sp.]|nr:hypothetical protein [Mycobacterium sp.]
MPAEYLDACVGVVAIQGGDEFAMLAFDGRQPRGCLDESAGSEPNLTRLQRVVEFRDHRIALV